MLRNRNPYQGHEFAPLFDVTFGCEAARSIVTSPRFSSRQLCWRDWWAARFSLFVHRAPSLFAASTLRQHGTITFQKEDNYCILMDTRSKKFRMEPTDGPRLWLGHFHPRHRARQFRSRSRGDRSHTF